MILITVEFYILAFVINSLFMNAIDDLCCLFLYIPLTSQFDKSAHSNFLLSSITLLSSYIDTCTFFFWFRRSHQCFSPFYWSCYTMLHVYFFSVFVNISGWPHACFAFNHFVYIDGRFRWRSVDFFNFFSHFLFGLF